MDMSIKSAVYLGCLLFASVACLGHGNSCNVDSLNRCNEVLFLKSGGETGIAGGLVEIEEQLLDVNQIKTVQLLSTVIKPGFSTEHWHYHQFDTLIIPTHGMHRLWWVNKQTGAVENRIIDAKQRVKFIIPQGVAHFVDNRRSVSTAEVIEMMLSGNNWKEVDFVKNRIVIDKAPPPALIIDE